MPVPDFQTIMLPLLECLSDNNEHSIHDIIIQIGKIFKLTDDEMNEYLDSGKQKKIYSRTNWAKTYLKSARLVEDTRRGHFKITNEGLTVLKNKPEKINIRYLEQYQGYIDFKNRRSKKSDSESNGDNELIENIKQTPEDLMETGYNEIKNNLITEILTKIKNCSPSFFEKLVIDLLVKMGYGGSIENPGKVLGKSHDGGIDGVIQEDQLGLDFIYIQAKRWESTVGSKIVREFIGALATKRAKKGVLITTSEYSNDAYETTKNIDSKIVLIDGVRLAEYMIKFNVGVSIEYEYIIKKIDNDYFEDE